MPYEIVVGSVLGFACLPFLYYVFALDSAWRFFGRPAVPDDPDFAPPVSVLKPIRGLDPHAFEHFSSFCRQDYPQYEILFAVADEDDPAIPIVRRLIKEFPAQSIRLIVGVPDVGPSSKVSKLCRLVREARYDLLVISDGDITVPQGYLRAVAAPFLDVGVGAVTCLYRGTPGAGIWSDLEAIGISTDFAPGVIVARRIEGVKFALGATMATTRTRLAEIGGFEALVEYCADDFELGHRIAARGHRVELARCTVSTESAPSGFREFFRHQLRWAVTMRHSRRWGYVGRVLVTQGLPWSVAAGAVTLSAAVAAAYMLAYILLRSALAWAVGVRGLRDRTVRRRWWLVPVYDLMACLISGAAFCVNRIDWRGRSFELQNGRLVPLSTPPRTAGSLTKS